MALVKYSALLERLSGKVGAAIFQENLGGSVLRQFCPPVRRNTIRQQKPRLIVNEVQQGWQLLSVLQRDTWEGWARYMRVHQRRNTALFISGHQSYLRVNQIRLQYSLPLLDNPVFNKCDLTPVSMSLSFFAPVLSLNFSRPMVPANEFAVLFITIPLPATWNNPRVHLKLLEFVTPASATTDITAAYFGLFAKLPAAASTLFIKYTNIDITSGLQFPFQSLKQTL